MPGVQRVANRLARQILLPRSVCIQDLCTDATGSQNALVKMAVEASPKTGDVRSKVVPQTLKSNFCARHAHLIQGGFTTNRPSACDRVKWARERPAQCEPPAIKFRQETKIRSAVDISQTSPGIPGVSLELHTSRAPAFNSCRPRRRLNGAPNLRWAKKSGREERPLDEKGMSTSPTRASRHSWKHGRLPATAQQA